MSSFDKLQQLAMLYLNQEARQGLATEHKDYIKYMRKEYGEDNVRNLIM